ncbi:molybdopterin synthase catalytic subunit [Methanobrevibacter cuticularis]|uniref:Molybdopterin synthase catalytic subunit n=1 Tax=Methanobrevibacter cuticularis TaxID=47311 RepID=A0A166DQM9_9EURY|nr:molybdenum cofactor biosynthesis protein MoaE [Methanobrevibacter cuticularis]KZX15852.1 molybdopterin synthase catalytic subunit [Methanobrevibacter cuticularis]
MIVKIIEKDDEYYSIGDLVNSIKKSKKVDKSGAIFTFEGIVRGEEEDLEVNKLILTTPNKEKTQKELETIAESVKIKFGVFEIAIIHYVGEFYTGDTLFMVAVLGPHRNETLDALKDTIERTKFDLEFKKEEISNTGTKIIMAGG